MESPHIGGCSCNDAGTELAPSTLYRRTYLQRVHKLGSQRCARLLHQGSELSRDDALQLVRKTAAQET